ncbi:MAG: helix-turn-helix transcriptional regulator [Fastidiosipila sp.]|nr:helix-turn-helix transcriptional regulator [Fastidiosipila sp.]
MDLIKTGLFISELRKQQGLTQKDLAEKIGVTDKAVSRWETGRGFPDVSILEPLAKALNVSVTEIVNGENYSSENIEDKSDKAIIEAFNYSKQMGKKILGILLLIVGFGLIISPQFSSGVSGFSLIIPLGILTVLAGVFVLNYKDSSAKNRRKDMILSKLSSGIISLIILATSIILEILPSGTVLIFAPGPDERIKQTFSYFSLIPFGYANFFPFLTAISTVTVSILLALALIKKSNVTRLQNAAFICTVIALIFSLMPTLIFGTDYITVLGILITILLLASLPFQAFANRKDRSDGRQDYR